jgi:CHAT domain-containing protein
VKFYTESGLLFAHDGRLVEARGSQALHSSHLFSPKCLANATWRTKLAGCHITLQACVSGHARANPQGDAIGLEWAFLWSGAASVLSTHWHISYEDAAMFSRSFYRNWLGRHQSRPEAWRSAAAELQRIKPNTAAWAAFSLSGEWRDTCE